jgi:hypothetical protein
MGVITLSQCVSLIELNAWEDEQLVEIGAYKKGGNKTKKVTKINK